MSLSFESINALPKVVLYTHPLTKEKISKPFPSNTSLFIPTVGWFFNFLFDGQLPIKAPSGLSLTVDNIRIKYHKHFFNPLSLHLQKNSKCFDVLEPHITFSLLGGKGGFGSMLRAQGNRMNSKKASNNDACRDLTGRRLKTVRAAEKLVEYIEGEPERREAKKAKIVSKIKRGLKLPTEQKVRFDDHDYLKECDELRSTMRGAVQQAVSSAGIKPIEKNPIKVASVFDDDLDTDSDSVCSTEDSCIETNSGKEEHSSEVSEPTQEIPVSK